MIEKIHNLSRYSVGWDGFDAVPPSSQALADAEAFASKLPFDCIHKPHVSLAADGEVNFLWRLPSMQLDLGFYGDGNYSFYAKLADGQGFGADEMPLYQTLPDELLKFLKL